MTVLLASTALQEVLLALKLAFLVFLYLFIWTIVRTAGRDLRVPRADSVILRPADAAAAGFVEPQAPPRHGPARRRAQPDPHGSARSTRSTRWRSRSGAAARTTSRSRGTSSPRPGTRASSRARDGVWAHDLGSTNGTYVNGEPLDGARRLFPGDVLRVGETDLRYEE